MNTDCRICGINIDNIAPVWRKSIIMESIDSCFELRKDYCLGLLEFEGIIDLIGFFVHFHKGEEFRIEEHCGWE